MTAAGVAVSEEGLDMSSGNGGWNQHGRTGKTTGEREVPGHHWETVVQFFVTQIKISVTVEKYLKLNYLVVNVVLCMKRFKQESYVLDICVYRILFFFS